MCLADAQVEGLHPCWMFVQQVAKVGSWTWVVVMVNSIENLFPWLWQ
jgi:hypothetical protein